MSNQTKYSLKASNKGLEACYNPVDQPTTWRSTVAIETSFPHFVFNLTLFLVVNHVLLLLLRPLRQPPVVAQIIAGVLVGPTILRQVPTFENMFPYEAMVLTETFANLALVYYTFLVGLEMDPVPTFKNSGQKVYRIAISLIVLPLCFGFAAFYLLHKSSKKGIDMWGSVIWAIALASTSFSDVAGVLADLKLLRSDVGRLALPSSVIGDSCTWVLFVVAMSILNARTTYALISTIGFVLICVFLVCPTISWIIERIVGDKGGLSDRHILFIMGWIVLFGLISDVCGMQSVVGSFMFGVIIPRGKAIRSKLIEKIDDYVSWILMPFFFLITGLWTDVALVLNDIPWHAVLCFVLLSFTAKILGALLVALFSDMPIREGLALGLTMNTKGLLALIIINAGRNTNVVEGKTYHVMVLAFLVMTCSAEPIIRAIYNPRKNVIRYKYRSVQSTLANPNKSVQFQVLACVHSIRDVSGVISLLEASNPNLDSPMSVVGVHLVELVGRATAMVVVHDQYKTATSDKPESSDLIMDAFKSYEKRNNAVLVQNITAFSPYETMDEDICSLAEEKQAALIILPYNKSLSSSLASASPSRPAPPPPTSTSANNNNVKTDEEDAAASVTNKVLAKAPCSVGLLVDNGLMSFAQMETEVGLRIAIIFIGGPDDREALACSRRLGSHPRVALTVLRFLVANDKDDSDRNIKVVVPADEKRLDDEFVYEFLFKTRNDNSISYKEKVLSSINGDRISEAIKEEGIADSDLYVVGRGIRKSLVQSSNNIWKSELGELGDLLTSSSGLPAVSLLVVQRYVSAAARKFREGVFEEFGTDSFHESPWHPLMMGNHHNSFGNASKDSTDDLHHDDD